LYYTLKNVFKLRNMFIDYSVIRDNFILLILSLAANDASINKVV